MNVPYTHSELVLLAARWLTGHKRCGVVITEMATLGQEIPDAIGWHSSHSILMECKTSRADFFANQRKNRWVGMGRCRYFFTPRGLILPDELPEGWGLLEWDGKHYHEAKPAPGREDYGWADEIDLLISALRRIGPAPVGVSCKVYTTETQNRAGAYLVPAGVGEDG